MAWNVELPPAEYYTLNDSAQIESLVREIEDQPKVAIDTETDGLSLWKSLPYYWSLSWESEGRERRITMPADTLPCFKGAFDDIERSWIFANAKFDTHMLANRGIDIKGKLVDVAVMHALLFEEHPHDLKYIAAQTLGWKWTDFTTTFGSLRKGICVCGAQDKSHKNGGFCKKTGCLAFRQVTALDLLERAAAQDMSKLVDYASNDAYGTWKAFLALKKQLEAEPTWGLYTDVWPSVRTLSDYFFNIEVPFTRALYTCERNGVKVDRSYLEELSPKLLTEIKQIRQEIISEVGYLINPSSGDDRRQYFFDVLKLKPKKMTSGGKSGIKQPSVDKAFLQSIEDDVPVAALMLQLDALVKTHSTYVEDVPSRLDPNDRIHGRLNQDVARTGRLSGSDPNLQNIPVGDKDKHGLRRSFICNEGNCLIVADYQALEMRLLAAASMEEKMCNVFHEKKDIHMGNASLIFNIPYDDIVKAKKIDGAVKSGELSDSALTDYVRYCLTIRQRAKTLGFGLNYGMKAKKLARGMGCSTEEAEETMNMYMATYPAVKQFFEEAVDDVRATGFAFTILGRRRRLSDIWSSSEMDRWKAERQGSNLPIQGSAADVCKMAMILINEDQLNIKYDCRMLLQVHDELVFEVPKEAADEVMPIIKEWMEHPFPSELAVPLTVEIGKGDSWGTAK